MDRKMIFIMIVFLLSIVSLNAQNGGDSGSSNTSSQISKAQHLVQLSQQTKTLNIDNTKGDAVLQDQSLVLTEIDFFEKIKTQRVQSDTTITWKNFGPGMSGYCEEFFCHPMDTNVMFLAYDMHVSYGTWDNGKSWQSIKDYDGDGLTLERVNDITFSLVDPDYGVAIERRGKVFETKDRGRTWKLIYVIPHAAKNKSYNGHSRIAIHPTNDSIIFIGAGGFWPITNYRSQAHPNGITDDVFAYGYILKSTDRGATWKKIATGISENLNVGRILINPNHPDTIVIATGQGMFRSTDGGKTWLESRAGLPNNVPKDLTAYYNSVTKEYILYTVEQSVYTEAGNTITSQGGAYKSIDDGVTWTNITGNLGFDFTKITDPIFKSKYQDAVAYWLGKDVNLIKTKDLPTQILPVFKRMVVNPLNKNELYLLSNQRHDQSFGPGDLWKTEDGGVSWKICVRHGKYWRSEVDKEYWLSRGNEIKPNVGFSHIKAAMKESHERYAGNRMLSINSKGEVFIDVSQQMQRSNDGGKSWQQVDDYETAPGSNAWIGRGESDLPGRFILTETGIPGRLLLCTGEHGLWKTTDLGNWKDKDAVAVKQIEGQVNEVGGNKPAHTATTVAVHPNNPNIIYMLIGRQEHRGKLRRSIDGGKTWENISTIFEASNNPWEDLAVQYSLIIDPKNPNNMYFASIRKPISEVGPGELSVVKTNQFNNLTGWTTSSLGDLSGFMTKGGFGVYHSFDGGSNWTLSNADFPINSSVRRIAMHPDNPEVIYAALNEFSSSDHGGLYKSVDKGVRWVKQSIPSEIKSVNNVFIDRNTKYIYISCGSCVGVYDAGGVWVSKNNGDSWEKIFKAPYVWQCETSPVNPDIIVISAPTQILPMSKDFMNPGIYLSKNAGNSWSKINKGLGQPDKIVDVKPDAYNEEILWCAGWGSGWFKAMIKTIP